MPTAPYLETLDRLYGLARFGEKFELDGPRALDRALGSPLGAVPCVLIGGTNGKGSTAAFVEALLQGRGLRVGLFTSPHLVSFRERIRIDGEEISEAKVVDLAARVLETAELRGIPLHFFEVVWAMAALAFAEASVDFAIWEVGLGGRLDATNACDPIASAVVTVGLDHQAFLGPDIWSIAREKAPIFRPGRPAFTAARGESLEALTAALEPGVGLQAVGRELNPFGGPLPLAGAHQADNAALALALVRAMGVTPDPTALQSVRWPGRAERAAPDLLLDCAHNQPAADALAALLLAEEGERRVPIDLIIGMMADKDVGAVLQRLAPLCRGITTVTPDHPRALSALELAARCPHARVSIGTTVGRALADRRSDALTVVAGSCFLVGEARAHLHGLEYPEGGLRTLAR